MEDYLKWNITLNGIMGQALKGNLSPSAWSELRYGIFPRRWSGNHPLTVDAFAIQLAAVNPLGPADLRIGLEKAGVANKSGV